tara:strand:+ start:192 stop:443 length:252 start_codon:yes stop_codon:yes gene_type:complete
MKNQKYLLKIKPPEYFIDNESLEVYTELLMNDAIDILYRRLLDLYKVELKITKGSIYNLLTKDRIKPRPLCPIIRLFCDISVV